jgi:hypothetical protein
MVADTEVDEENVTEVHGVMRKGPTELPCWSNTAFLRIGTTTRYRKSPPGCSTTLEPVILQDLLSGNAFLYQDANSGRRRGQPFLERSRVVYSAVQAVRWNIIELSVSLPSHSCALIKE